MTETATPIRAGDALIQDGIRAVNFFNGRLVTSRDFARDQDARREGDARLGEAIGAGIVQGLRVERSGAPTDRKLQVLAGLAVSRSGQTLCLGTNQVLALVPEADDTAPASTGGFGACKQLTGGTYVAGNGLYLVTLAPASQPDGKAEVLALEPGNLRCNSDVVVEAVQLRLLHVRPELLDARGIDSNASEAATVSRLRSAAAAACLGLSERIASHGNPGTQPAANLLDDMAGRGLSDCDVPLALVFLTASDGLVFVDRWSVRREVAASTAAPPWDTWFGEPGEALAQAAFAQFQEQLGEIPAASLAGLRAQDWFTWLPPAGFLDASGSRVVDWQAFLGARKPARTVDLAPGDAPAVLAEALRRDPVPLAGSTPAFRVYRIAGGPWLFVRDAPNARHAAEVWLDSTQAGLAGEGAIADVQAAIDVLFERSCAQLVLRPGLGAGRAQALIDGLDKGADLMLCIEDGILRMEEPLVLAGLGHVRIHGHGAASLLYNLASEVALRVEACDSLEVHALALRADKPGSGKDRKDGKGVGRLGALTVIDTPLVRIAEVSARCGGAELLGACAITVTYRDPASDGSRRVHVSSCELWVGPGQQGLSCIHCDQVTVRDNVVLPVQSERPMRAGIVVAGEVAREVCIEHNVVEAPQGIKLALSRRESVEEAKALQVEHAVVAANRIRVPDSGAVLEMEAVDRELLKMEKGTDLYGVFVGHADSLRVEANHISSASGKGSEGSGILLYGAYGLRLLLRDNHVRGLRNGIEIVMPEGASKRGDCLWVVEANLAEQAQEVIVAASDVMDALRRANNVLA